MTTGRLLLLSLLLAASLPGQSVRALFNPSDPSTGPFPTDRLTLTDPLQKTGLRINLPTAGCTPGGDCEERLALNTLDGFHIAPRITLRFDASVNIDTLRAGVFILWLDPAYSRPYLAENPGLLMPVNQIQWDASTSTAYLRPDQILEQGRRYAILVTDGVKDWNGQPVVSSPEFDACLASSDDYCRALAAAVASVPQLKVVAASLFTTLSATAWLEDAYAASTAAPVRFTPTAPGIVRLSDVGLITWRQQMKVDPSAPFGEFTFPLRGNILALTGIGRVAFGSIRCPRYTNPVGLIAPGPAAPVSQEEIYFHVWLPATPPPPGGYPVVLAGHGAGDSRFGGPSLMALAIVPRGFAVVAMTAAGHGYGPSSTLRLSIKGADVDVPAPGRAADLNRDGQYAAEEGCLVFAPGLPVGARDCFRQTAADYFTLVRAIRSGIDLAGDGSAPLNPDNISYIGQSFGSFYGALVTAVDPAVRSAVFNVGGGSLMELARKAYNRTLLAAYFALRQPALLSPLSPFDEQYPDRWQPVKTLTAPNAAAINEVNDRADWLQASGSPMAFAPYFSRATPAANPIKNILMQVALGDQTVPNSASSQLMRSANMVQNTSIYRHDLAVQVAAELPANPHTYLAWLIETPAQAAIAQAALTQAGLFLANPSVGVPDVNAQVRSVFGRNLFEIPALPPESQNFIVK